MRRPQSGPLFFFENIFDKQFWPLPERHPLAPIDPAAPLPAAASAYPSSTSSHPALNDYAAERERPTLGAAAVARTTAVGRASASGHPVIGTESLLRRRYRFLRGDRLAPRPFPPALGRAGIRLTPSDREHFVAARAARPRDAGLGERVPMATVRAHQVPVAHTSTHPRGRAGVADDSPLAGRRDADLKQRA